LLLKDGKRTMKSRIILIIFMLIVFEAKAQRTKIYKATFLETAPKIDAIEDSIWETVPIASNFVQVQPFNGKKPTKPTEVKLAYTEKAIYIFAKIYDDPKKINAFLTQKDQEGQSDWFAVSFDTYNNGLLAYTFAVTASNVHIDYKSIGTKKDYAWNPVWTSKVSRNKYGWTVEMKIPFNMLRFNKKNLGLWHINFYRHIQRNRETDSWNYIDIKSQEEISQYGILEGIDKVKSGPRIELYPYLSAGLVEQSANTATFRRGGMDLKMGLSKSFTLDMMLIPDFGEVFSDEQTLNLTPYEVYYSEQRPFFTEGTEIFNLGGIFYSRRIGGQPAKYSEVANYLREGETIVENPSEVQILNATKISGKTKNGYGIGFLNTVTSNTFALLYDTINDQYRQIITEPLTNYNVIAVEKDLPNNSYIGIINTNKTVPLFKRSSNVTAVEANIKDRTKTISVYTKIGMSNIFHNWNEKPFSGIGYSFAINKIKGNFRTGISRTSYSDQYYINDMGYLPQNNIITNRAYVAYYIFKPFWKIQNWKTTASFSYKSLYSNQNFVGMQIDFATYGTLRKSLTSLGLAMSITPGNTYDYFEPRVDNYVFIEPPKQSYKAWISTNYSKPFAVDLHAKLYYPLSYIPSQYGYGFTFIPRFRISKYTLTILSLDYNIDLNDYGFITTSPQKDTVYFGRRNIQTVENKAEINIMFSPKAYFTLRLRHYWTLLFYTGIYSLSPQGSLEPIYNSSIYIPDQNINFNIANIEFVFKWEFLPGSEISVTYKKELSRTGTELIPEYLKNFDFFIKNSDYYRYLSLKLVFFI